MLADEGAEEGGTPAGHAPSRPLPPNVQGKRRSESAWPSRHRGRLVLRIDSFAGYVERYSSAPGGVNAKTGGWPAARLPILSGTPAAN